MVLPKALWLGGFPHPSSHTKPPEPLQHRQPLCPAGAPACSKPDVSQHFLLKAAAPYHTRVHDPASQPFSFPYMLCLKYTVKAARQMWGHPAALSKHNKE